MPGFDRTGPKEQGFRTGRGLGKCNPNTQRSNEQLNDKGTPRGLRRRFRHGIGEGKGTGQETFTTQRLEGKCLHKW